MATLISSISSIFRHPATTSARTDHGVAKPMLLSALKDNAVPVISIAFNASLGAMVVALVAMSLPFAPGVGFYSALSASLAMVYIASLTDVRGLRDAINLVTIAVFVLAVLTFNPLHPVWVGLTLFTHVFMSFTTGISRSSGSLRELNLWPALFGIELAVLIIFVNQVLV